MAYQGVDWQNKPNHTSPINRTNLEIMDNGITENDRRITVLETDNKDINESQDGVIKTFSWDGAAHSSKYDRAYLKVKSGDIVYFCIDYNQYGTSAFQVYGYSGETGTALTSGTLTAGTVYKIIVNGDYDSFGVYLSAGTAQTVSFYVRGENNNNIIGPKFWEINGKYSDFTTQGGSHSSNSDRVDASYSAGDKIIVTVFCSSDKLNVQLYGNTANNQSEAIESYVAENGIPKLITLSNSYKSFGLYFNDSNPQNVRFVISDWKSIFGSIKNNADIITEQINNMTGAKKVEFSVGANSTHASTEDRILLNALGTDEVAFVITPSESVKGAISYKDQNMQSHSISIRNGSAFSTPVVFKFTNYSDGVYDVGVYIQNQSGNSANILFETFVKTENAIENICNDYCFIGNNKKIIVRSVSSGRLNLFIADSIQIVSTLSTRDRTITTSQMVSMLPDDCVSVTGGVVLTLGSNKKLVYNYSTDTLEIVNRNIYNKEYLELLVHHYGGICGGLLYGKYIEGEIESATSPLNLFAYITNGAEFSFSRRNGMGEIIIPSVDMFLRGDIVRTITQSEILTAASASSLVSVSGNSIKGYTFALVYNVSTDSIEFVRVGDAIELNRVVLFAHHYSSINAYGLFYDYEMQREESLEYKGIPGYYNSYIVSKLKNVQDNIDEIGIDGETFVFITDVHWDTGNSKKSSALVRKIFNETNVNTLICGGDIINEGEKDAQIEMMMDFVKSFYFTQCTLPIAFGNHDNNKNAQWAPEYESRWLTRNDVFGVLMKPASNSVTYLSDYDWSFVYDRIATKTRFLFIDTGERGVINASAKPYIYNALNDVPVGYNVIIVAHWLYDSNDDVLTSTGEEVASVADAYNSKTTITVDDVTYDYSNANGEIKAIMIGHAHIDATGTTTGGIPWMVSDSDNHARSLNSANRTDGTVTEQCFDVVSVNYQDGSIKTVRFGYGNNRAFSNGAWS